MIRILTLIAAITFDPQGIHAVATQQGSSAIQTESGENAGKRSVTIDAKNETLEHVLREIASQAGMQLFYNAGTVSLNGKVSLAVKNTPVQSALASATRGTGLVAIVAGDGATIMVSKAASPARSAQGVITGKVTDAKTGKRIPGASISISSGPRSTLTGEDGSYRLAGVSTGTHTMTVRLVGYTKQARSVVVGEGATVTADFKLEASANVLSQVVVTGTVVATELKAVPSAITVITAKQIEDRGITKIAQLFRGDVPGMFAENAGTGSSNRTIMGGDENLLDEFTMFSRGGTSFSGTYTNHIKIYLDGIELTNPSYVNQVDPKSIERIEILTGPQASTIYGSNAINGVMQIFTKRGSQIKPQVSLSLMSGWIENSFNDARAPQHDYMAGVSGTEGRASYNVGGGWNYVGPWTPAKQTTRRTGFGGSRMSLNKLTVDGNARIGLTDNRQRGTTRQVISEQIRLGIRPAGPSGVLSPKTQSLASHTYGFTSVYSPIGWWSHELTFGNDESNSLSLITGRTYGSPSDTLLLYNQWLSKKITSRYTTTARLPLTSLGQITLTLGADRTRSTFQQNLASNIAALTGSFSGSIYRVRPSTSAGGFFQSQWGIADALFMTYGVRLEWNDNFGSEANPNVTPRYGIAYTRELGAITTKLRGSYGRSTRSPDATQRLSQSFSDTYYTGIYGRDYEYLLANPDLEPEHQQGGEGGLELYFGTRASINITRYNQTVDNLITSVIVDSMRSLEQNPSGCTAKPDGYCYEYQQRNLNIGSIRNQGWELQGMVNMGFLTTKGTYSWTKSRVIGITPKYRSFFPANLYPVLQPGATFTYLPEHTWATSFIYAYGKTSVSLDMNGVGFLNRFQDDNNNAIASRLPQNRPRMQLPNGYRPLGNGYMMADLNASQRFTGKIEGVLQVQNLNDYYQNDFNAAFPVIGRQARMGLRIKW